MQEDRQAATATIAPPTSDSEPFLRPIAMAQGPYQNVAVSRNCLWESCC